MGRGGAAGIHNLPLTLSMDDFTSSPTLSAYSVKRVDFLELSYCLTIKKASVNSSHELKIRGFPWHLYYEY